MIFSSLLETWGLPISEYKMLNKPIFLSDLPYAHETLGDYSKSRFFDPYHAGDLADGMKRFLDGKECIHAHSSVHIDTPHTVRFCIFFKYFFSRKYAKPFNLIQFPISFI